MNFKEAIEASKKLQVSILDLIPAFYTLAKGEGLVKAGASAIKWGLFAAAVPIVAQLGIVLFGLGAAIRHIVGQSGTLQAAISKLVEIKNLEKVFNPLLGGIDAAQKRVASLLQFIQKSPFTLKGAAEASRQLELLTHGALSSEEGLKTVGDAAAASGNDIQDVAGQVGVFYRQLKNGEDIKQSAEELRNLGVISDQTARQIVTLQDAGAGFSDIWSKVSEDLHKSAGAMERVQEEIGGVQGRFVKSREALATAFGAPFIEAERQGLINYTKAMDNLRPAAAAVANTLSTVTNVTDTIKSKVAVFFTSIPHLGESVGVVTKAALAATGAISLIGATQTVGRILTIKKVFDTFREPVAKKAKIAEAGELRSDAENYRQVAATAREDAVAAAQRGDSVKIRRQVSALNKQAAVFDTAAVRRDLAAATTEAEAAKIKPAPIFAGAKLRAQQKSVELGLAQANQQVIAEGLRKDAEVAATAGKPARAATLIKGAEQAEARAATLGGKAVAADLAVQAATPLAVGARAAGAGITALGKAIGTFLINPATLAVTGVAALTAALWSLRETHVANKKALDDLHNAFGQTLGKLDSQIASITTLDDKMRALAATTNALAEARTKLAAAKIPSDENRLTIIQRFVKEVGRLDEKIQKSGKIGAAVEDGFTRTPELSKGEQAAAAARDQINALEERQKQIRATKPVVSEREVGQLSRRAIAGREIEQVEVQQQLQRAPDAATRQAIFEAQALKFKTRAESGRAEELRQEKTLTNEEFVRSQGEEQKQATRAANATETLGSEPFLKVAGAEEANRKEREQVTKIVQTTPGTTIEEAQAQADDLRIKAIREDITKRQAAKAAEPERVLRQQADTGITEQTKILKQLEIRKDAESKITHEKETQATILRASESELLRITRTIEDLNDVRKVVTFEGQTIGAPAAAKTNQEREAVVAQRGALFSQLVPRAALLKDNIDRQNTFEVAQKEAAVAAKEEEIRKRTETINIEAERKILNVKTEGLDREEELGNIKKTQLSEEIAGIQQVQAEAEKAHPEIPKVAPEDIPAVVEKRLEQQQLTRRQEIHIPREREDIALQTKAIEIEAEKGRGPEAEIAALQKQLALNQEITGVIQQRANSKVAPLDTAEAKRQLTQQAAARNEIRKALEDAVFSQGQANEAARSETDQLELSLTGHERLAELEGIRLKYTQAIAQAARDGNTAIAEQLALQGRQAIASNLGHQLSPDLHETNKEFVDRQREEQDQARHKEQQQRIAQAAINSATSDEARGAKLDENSDVTKALRAQQSLEQAQATKQFQAEQEAQIVNQATSTQTFTKEQIAEHPGVKTAAEASVLEHETATRSASEAQVKFEETEAKHPGTGTKPTEAQQHELKVAAAPFKEALDSSTVLGRIAAAVEKPAGPGTSASQGGATEGQQSAPPAPGAATTEHNALTDNVQKAEEAIKTAKTPEQAQKAKAQLQEARQALQQSPTAPTATEASPSLAGPTEPTAEESGLDNARRIQQKTLPLPFRLQQLGAGEPGQNESPDTYAARVTTEANEPQQIGNVQGVADSYEARDYAAIKKYGSLENARVQMRKEQEAETNRITELTHPELAQYRAAEAEQAHGQPAEGTPEAPATQATGTMGHKYDEHGNPADEQHGTDWKDPNASSEAKTPEDAQGGPVVGIGQDMGAGWQGPSGDAVPGESPVPAPTPPAPAEPAVAQPAQQGGGGGDNVAMLKVLTDIQKSIDNLTQKVGVA